MPVFLDKAEIEVVQKIISGELTRARLNITSDPSELDPGERSCAEFLAKRCANYVESLKAEV